MAYHGVLIPEQIAAMNVDSYNRSLKSSASAIDNGFVVYCNGKSGIAGESEVFLAATPATASLSGLWMAYSGDEVVLTDGRCKGIDPDPRNFFSASSAVFSAFKPQVGDIILATAECFTGTAELAFVNAVNGKMQLTWGANQVASVMSWKYLATKYISLADGSIGSQRVTAYQLECIAN